ELVWGSEGAEWFVRRGGLGLEDRGPPERDGSRHPTRQRGREGVLETLEAGHAHGGRYPPLLRVAPDAAVLEAQRDVPPHGPPREHRVLLEHVPHVGGHTRDGPAVDLDDSRGGLDEAGDHVEDRRLAAARRPHDRHEFLVADLERDVADGFHRPRRLAKGLREIANDDARPTA